MALARIGDESDVYVYEDCDGQVVCSGCLLNNNRVITFSSYTEAIEHLIDHQERRHAVPDYVINQLGSDRRDYGDDIKNAQKAMKEHPVDPLAHVTSWHRKATTESDLL